MDEKFAWLMIIPAAIILLLVLPIVIEGRVSFNPLYNRGVVALYIFGVSSIKEFALPLMVGIICGTYSSICLASALWYIFKTKMAKAK